VAVNRRRHLIAVGLSAVMGLAVTSGAASSPAAFAGPVTALAIDPGSASVVYAASSAGGVSKSVDSGQTWQRLAVPSSGVVDLVAHPIRPGVVYAAMGRKGMFKTKDGGRSWRAMNTGLRGLRVSVLAIARTTPEVVYAGTSSLYAPFVPFSELNEPPSRHDGATFIFKSTNGGRSWHESWQGHWTNEVRDVTVDPKHASTVWATTYGFVLKSPNGGRTWPSGMRGCTAHACQLPGPMGAAGPPFPQIALSPQTPMTVYLGAGGGIHRSPDGGRSWTGNPLPRGSTFAALALDPRAADSLFVATNRGVYKRAENRRGWEAIGRRTETFSLAIDSRGTTLYAGTRRGVVAYRLRQ